MVGHDNVDMTGWADRVMVFLRFAAQLVAINLLMALGTLAGAVVLGLYPALGAGSGLLARLAAGDPSEHLLREFWDVYRSQFWRLNLLGVPFTVAAVFLATDSEILAAASPGPLTAFLGLAVWLLSAYLVVALMVLVRVARRYDEPAGRTWRFVVLAPLLGPLTSLVVLLTLAVLVLTFARFVVLVPLVGLSLPLLVSGWLVDQRLTRIDTRHETDVA